MVYLDDTKLEKAKLFEKGLITKDEPNHLEAEEAYSDLQIVRLSIIIIVIGLAISMIYCILELIKLII